MCMKMNIKKTMRFDTGSMVQGLHALCKDLGNYYEGNHIDIVEVGSYAGESASIFLQILNCSITCVDAWEANSKYKEDDIHQAHNRILDLLGNNSRVTLFKSDSCDERLELVKGIDFVYIDADHSYESVIRDVSFWRERCQVIGGHDYDNTPRYGVKRAIDELFGKPDAVYVDGSWIKYLNK